MYIDRPPRLQAPIPIRVIDIPPPPKLEAKRQAMWQTLTPIITILAYVLISVMGRGSNPLFILPMAFSVVLSTALAIYNAVETRRQQQEEIRNYKQRIKQMRHEMQRSHEEQRNYYLYNFPSPSYTFSINGMSADYRSGTRLWERRSHDEDFAVVRLGIGNRPSTVIYKLSSVGDAAGNPLLVDAERLALDSQLLTDVPIIIPLYDNPVWAMGKDNKVEDTPPIFTKDVRSTIGIIGSDKSQVYQFIYAMITNLTSLHSPNDLELFVLGTNEAVEYWDWAYELPHVVINANRAQSRLYFEDIEWISSPEEGRVKDIRVEIGQIIKPGDVVLSLTTSKQETLEIKARHRGRVHQIVVEINQPVSVNTPFIRTQEFDLSLQQLEEERYGPKKLQGRERGIAGVPQFWKQRIWAELDRRERRIRDNLQGTHSLPLMVLIVDLQHLNYQAEGQERSWLEELEGEAAIALIMSKAASLGIAVFFLTAEPQKVPSGCQSVIELQKTTDKLSFLYGETGLNSARYLGVADLIDETIPAPSLSKNAKRLSTGELRLSSGKGAKDTKGILQAYSQLLQQWRVRRSYGADIPRSVSLMDLYRAELIDKSGLEANENIRDLKILDQWDRSLKQPEWLKIPLGMLAGQEPRELNFFADADGVHGMIAGSTGSGKSELLTTLVLSLAVKYDPRIVNFVLIDYKGGGAFEPLSNLPHVVDTVTNLRPSAVARMFAAIGSELNSRQKINRDTGAKDIVEYRKKGLHRDMSRRPYPHLFIIIDEFAEMIANNPEYKDQLDSIARLGRALGVSLILAAQRPTGVTDQMRANIKFRICLRVENKDESQELLRLPDAAYLPSIPGRGYLQVGSESLELIQVGWTGADYRDMPDYDPDERLSNLPIIWESKLNDDEEDPLFAVLDRRLRRYADIRYPIKAGQPRPWRKPWPNPLPNNLYLDNPHGLELEYIPSIANSNKATEDKLPDLILLKRANSLAKTMPNYEARQELVLAPHLAAWQAGAQDWPRLEAADWEKDAMCFPVGIADYPSQAQIRLVTVDFHEGHHAVLGVAASGKTTFLRTTLMSMISKHPPKHLHLYLLDFGASYGLKIFEQLPHVAGYVQIHEREKIERVFRISDKIIEDRKNLLSSKNLEDIFVYNRQNLDDILPPVIIVIDNFAAFRQSYEEIINETLQAQVREGAAVGVYFLISAEQSTALGRLGNLISNKFALRAAERSEYSTIVGKNPPDFEELPGRGVVAIDRVAMVFQTAQAFSLNDAELAIEMEAFIKRMNTSWKANFKEKYPRPEAVRELEKSVALKELMLELEKQPMAQAEGKTLLIGRDDFTLKASFLNLGIKPHIFISGGPQSGKTSLLQSIVLWLAQRYSPDKIGIILVDVEGSLADFGSTITLDMLPHMDMPLIKDEKGFNRLLKYFSAELDGYSAIRPSRPIYVIIDNLSADNANELIGAGADASREQKKEAEVTARTFKDWARVGGKQGLHFIAAGDAADLSKASPIFGPIASTRYGIAFSEEEASGKPFHATVPRSFRSLALPRGRGFIAAPTGLEMAQFALPFQNEAQKDEEMKDICQEIIGEYPQKALRVDEFLGSESDESSASELAVEPSRSPEQANGPSADASEKLAEAAKESEEKAKNQKPKPLSNLTDEQRECLKNKLAELLGVPNRPDLAMRSLVRNTDENLQEMIRVNGADPADCL